MKKHLIAVVDDEADLLENFQMLLEDQFEVATFKSPSEFLKALPLLKSQNLRLLVTDYKMPEMNGLEMVQKAHQQLPPLPFIILSGYLDKNTILQAVKMGVFQVLEKPSKPEDLLAAIDQLLTVSELENVRSEIRQLTSQLRELYSSVRMMLLEYLPADTIDRLVVDAPNGLVTEKMSFEDLLQRLESRLDQLLKTEQMIGELKK